MAEILSQDDIDALLTEISTGESATEAHSEQKQAARIKIYDFGRPEKFTKEHIRNLESIHASFARITGAMLAARTGTNAGMYVASVDQLTYDEFIRSLPCPALMAVYNMKPLAGPVIMEIDPSISGIFMESLFGGKPSGLRVSDRITEMEAVLVESMFDGLVANMCYAWSDVVELKPGFVSSETNPNSLKAALPGDMLVLVSLETKIGNVEGMMNIAVPYITLEPVMERLTSVYMSASAKSACNADPVMNPDDAAFKRCLLYPAADPGFTPESIRMLKPGMRIPLNPQAEAGIAYEYAGTGKGVRNV